MNLLETADMVDTAVSVGMLALTIGCPVAGVTWFAAKMMIKQGAKIAIKRYALGTVAGVTATAAAFFATGSGEGDGSSGVPFMAPPGISQEMLEVEFLQLVVEPDSNGDDSVRIGENVVTRDQIFLQLYPLISFGKLGRVEYRINLPDKQHGEWSLYMKEIESSLENVKPSFEFVESTLGGSSE
ncbi:MAG: hypothetical protein KF752_09390 [Pirellulaceae bacterium]|nr:hypothetical protein [Pirellulaceae bacterium]